MRKECERLAAAHAAILKSGLSPASRDELFRAAHDIKGDAATFGYPLAAAAADSLCRLMEHAPDFTKVPNELIAHHVNAIQAIVREHKKLGVASVADELAIKLRGIADEYLTAVNQDRPEHLELILGPSIVPGE
jgi:HPt (histidine-containing phosphotransfer) domain-containing protein